MILIDTSIWADHFHRPIPALLDLIAKAKIAQHPFVTGELALGNPTNRERMVSMMNMFPPAIAVDHAALMQFVQAKAIGGTGVGFVDAHLLASADVTGDRIWTRDRRLADQAERLNLLHDA